MCTKSLDLGSLCRTCMANCSKVSPGTSFTKLRRSIYQIPIGWDEGPKIMDLLRSVQPQIQVHVKDKLPKIMCTNCIDKLLMTYEFLEMCKDTDKNFRKIFKSSSTRNDGTEEHLEFEVEKEECNKSDYDTIEQQPDINAMFTNKWSNDDDGGLNLSDNSFGFDSEESYDTSMDTRRPSRKRSKNSTNKSSKHNVTNKEIDEPYPNKKICKQDEKPSLNDTAENSNQSSTNMNPVSKEILALRAEVKHLRSLGTTTDTNLLLSLPFHTLSDLQEFDSKIVSDDDLRFQLKNIIHRLAGEKLPYYLRNSIKTVISDELAVDITWRGTPDKPSFKRFHFFAILKDICLLRFDDMSDSEFNRVCQQHFAKAGDRIKKAKTNEKYSINFSSENSDQCNTNTEIKLLKSLDAAPDANILLYLPFYSLADLQEFDSKLISDEKLRFQVQKMIHRVGGEKFCKFLRTAIKTIISDELAINVSWRGMPDKPSFRRFALYALLKDICHSKYYEATDSDIDKVCQQHFLHAQDRVRSKQRNAST